MRNGFILLHRKGLTPDEWKHPMRTLAWIDFCTMAAYEDFTAEDGVKFQRGEVVVSYGFLANRWRVSKDSAYQWMKHWIAERQVERRTERCAERSAERFFIVNYAKYQDSAERVAERPIERSSERTAEQMKRREKETSHVKQAYATRPETDALYDTIESLCSQYNVANGVNKKSLDVLVGRYVGKVQMKVETQHCLAWLIDKGLRTVSTQRLGNWFRKALEIQKREKLRQLERREIPGADGGVNARANADRFPEDCNVA